MSKTTKRKRYTGAFKAKVGLEALMGIKTVGQIAREYQVHPVQVTQWKGVIRDHLPELFESPQAASQDQEQLIAHESSLKQREEEILGALFQGLQDKEIASALGIGTATVHTHMHRLFEKLGVHSRRDIIAKYFKLN